MACRRAVEDTLQVAAAFGFPALQFNVVTSCSLSFSAMCRDKKSALS